MTLQTSAAQHSIAGPRRRQPEMLSGGFGWKSCVCEVKEWFLCTQGFVQRWGSPGAERRCWLFVGGDLSDGAWTAMS